MRKQRTVDQDSRADTVANSQIEWPTIILEHPSAAEDTARQKEITSLEAKIARLELEATRSVGGQDPDTAHYTRKSYDEICEEIISLKRRRLNELERKAV